MNTTIPRDSGFDEPTDPGFGSESSSGYLFEDIEYCEVIPTPDGSTLRILIHPSHRHDVEQENYNFFTASDALGFAREIIDLYTGRYHELVMAHLEAQARRVDAGTSSSSAELVEDLKSQIESITQALGIPVANLLQKHLVLLSEAEDGFFNFVEKFFPGHWRDIPRYLDMALERNEGEELDLEEFERVRGLALELSRETTRKLFDQYLQLQHQERIVPQTYDIEEGMVTATDLKDAVDFMRYFPENRAVATLYGVKLGVYVNLPIIPTLERKIKRTIFGKPKRVIEM